MREKIKLKNWFFQKMNKIDKLLARLANTKREKTPITNIKNATGYYNTCIATGRIVREC